jgi:hypothetical protein
MQKCYKMHCGVRLHGWNACYIIFWNIAPKTGYTWTEGIATHFICIYDFLTESTNIYEERFVGLKKIQ